jgi:hypothetical protein
VTIAEDDELLKLGRQRLYDSFIGFESLSANNLTDREKRGE